MTVIKYHQRRNLQDVMMLIVAAIFVPFACLIPWGLCAAVIGLPEMLSQQGLSGLTDVEDMQMWGLICVAMILCPLILGFAIYSLLPLEATLSDDVFTYGRRGLVKRLRLADIVYVGDENRFLHMNLRAWKVQIKDKGNQRISLLVGSRRNMMYYAQFDYQVMLGDLLERLPPEAEVSPSVRRFVEMD